MIDDEDFDKLSKLKWQAQYDLKNGNFYAVSMQKVSGKLYQRRMHRILMAAEKGHLVDHKDGNSLNNQKANLRLCDSQQNGANARPITGGTSKYKGVCWSKRGQKWVVQVTSKGVRHHIGRFTDEVEAAKAYNDAAILHHGEFAYLNTFDPTPNEIISLLNKQP